MEKIKNVFVSFCVYLFWFLVVCGAIYGAYVWFKAANKPITYNSGMTKPFVKIEKPNYEVNIKKVKAEIEAKKVEVVDALCTHGVNGNGGGESSTLTIENGDFKITFDPASSMKAKCSQSGGSMDLECISVGVCQTKIPTAQMFMGQLGLATMTDMDTMLMLHDEGKAKEFVKKAIFGIPGSIWHWTYAKNNEKWFREHIEEIREKEAFIKELETI